MALRCSYNLLLAVLVALAGQGTSGARHQLFQSVSDRFIPRGAVDPEISCSNSTSPFGRQLLQAGQADALIPKTCEEVYKVNPKARESGSCSLGSVRGFVAPIANWDDIRELLRARSYKGEIIVTQDTRTEAVAQWLWRLLRMGFAHTVVVMRGEHSCAPIRQLFGEVVGCVWFTTTVTFPSPNGASSFTAAAAAGVLGAGMASGGAAAAPAAEAMLAPKQLALFNEEAVYGKIQMVALILRLGGTNVLAMDTDTLLLDDFYWWMNTTDYQGYQLLSQVDGMGTLNIGFMYFRDVSPSGPVAWAVAETMLRNVRWREQPQVVAAFNGSMHNCWDQSVFTDAVYSALVGRPLFWRCLEVRALDRTWNVREDGHKAYVAAVEALVKPALRKKVFDMTRSGPACHRGTTGPEGLFSSEGVLTMPHHKGVWPAELGGRALGDMGPVAKAFLAMMAGSGTPMWPDMEDPGSEPYAAKVPPERFAYFSAHAVCDWSGCGQNGMYMPHMRPAGEEPCVVAGHFVVSPDTPLGKRFQFIHNGAVSLPLAHLLHGPGGTFFATNVHQGGGGLHHAARAGGVHHARLGQQVPLPKVIALAPGAISRGPAPAPASASSASSAPGSAPLVLASKEHMVAVVVAMSSVAIAAGRTLAVPKLSCDYPWMHRGPAFPYNGTHYVPWRYLDGSAFAPYGPSTDSMSCEWFAWVQHGCLHGPVHVEKRGHGHANTNPVARMLLSVEMDHFLELLPAAERVPQPVAVGAAASATSAAAGAAVGGGNLVAPPPGSVAGPDGVYNVTAAELSAALSAVSPEHPVVWLERPMRVTDLPAQQETAHRQWMNHCCGLIWPRGFNHICFWPF